MQGRAPSPDLQRAEFGTQIEEGSDIPGSLLDIVFERICVVLPEIPQEGGTLHYFPHTQDDHPDEVEKQSKYGENLHAPPEYRCVSFTVRFS